jgi:hypothetical protein
MASFIELNFYTPTGTKTATVFTDANGHVTSEHGLSALLTELKRRKNVKSSPTIDQTLTSVFFDMKTPISPNLEKLRKEYAVELKDADNRGCSKCDRAAIYRKYVTMVNKING